MQEEKPQIDQNALSRQLAVYGAEAQGKLMSMRVFIHGLTGVYIYLKLSFLSKSPKILFSQAPNKSHSLIKPLSLSKTLEEISTAAPIKLEIPPELRHVWLNWKNSTQAAQSTPQQTIASNLCNFIFYLSSKNFECVVVLDNYNREYLIKLNKACR